MDMCKIEPGPYGVRMVRQSGEGSTDLAHVSKDHAERHAAYLETMLDANPNIARVEIIYTGW